jgi:hypothetical protein
MGENGERRVFGGDAATQDAWAKAGYDTDEHPDLRTADGNGTGKDATEKATASQQRTDDGTDGSLAAGRDYREPRYDPNQMALLSERSETRAACIQAKAQGTAGYGFEVVPHGEADDPSDETRKIVTDFWFGQDSTFQLGPDRQPATAKEVHVHAREDYEDIGWLALEVLAAEDAKPTGLAHVPAHTVRRRKGAPGYVQLDSAGMADTYFGAAGARYGDDKTFADADTGERASST